jgi:hypothetical protein
MPPFWMLQVFSFLGLVTLAALLIWGLERKGFSDRTFNWIFRVAFLGWIVSEALQVILYPRLWGKAMQSLFHGIGL